YGVNPTRFYMVTKINGHSVRNSITTTANNSTFAPPTVEFTKAAAHPVPPGQRLTLHIEGTTHYAVPVNALFGKNYDISGDISFTPQADQTYTVRGVLTTFLTSVWVEDAK